MTSGNNLQDLTHEVNNLVQTIKQFSNFEEHLRSIPPMVRYVNAPASQHEMSELIRLIRAEVGNLENHEIYKIVAFFTDTDIKQLID